MLGHKKGEVGVFRVHGRIFIAVAVYRNDPVGVLVYHHAVRIHAEGPDQVVVLLGAVYDLALIELVRKLREDFVGKFHADSYVHTVGLLFQSQIVTDRLHPLGARATYGYDELFRREKLRGVLLRGSFRSGSFHLDHVSRLGIRHWRKILRHVGYVIDLVHV